MWTSCREWGQSLCLLQGKHPSPSFLPSHQYLFTDSCLPCTWDGVSLSAARANKIFPDIAHSILAVVATNTGRIRSNQVVSLNFPILHLHLLHSLLDLWGCPIFGETFGCVIIALKKKNNPPPPQSIYGSHIMSSWMMHAGCVFVVGIDLSRTWMSGYSESVWWNACVHKKLRPQITHSCEAAAGSGVRSYVYSMGKIPPLSIFSQSLIFSQQAVFLAPEMEVVSLCSAKGPSKIFPDFPDSFLVVVATLTGWIRSNQVASLNFPMLRLHLLLQHSQLDLWVSPFSVRILCIWPFKKKQLLFQIQPQR